MKKLTLENENRDIDIQDAPWVRFSHQLMDRFCWQISVKSNLSVGLNLQDHLNVPLAPLMHNDSKASLVQPGGLMVRSWLPVDGESGAIYNLSFLVGVTSSMQAWWDYLVHGGGQYTSNGVDGMAFASSGHADRSDWPDLQLHWLSYSAASDHGVRSPFLTEHHTNKEKKAN